MALDRTIKQGWLYSAKNPAYIWEKLSKCLSYENSTYTKLKRHTHTSGEICGAKRTGRKRELDGI
jgi:hypothetical protein